LVVAAETEGRGPGQMARFRARWLVYSVMASMVGLFAGLGLTASAAAQSGCISVTTNKGLMTAAMVDPTSPVTGTVQPTGCDIGVYFGPGTTGMVDDASIQGFQDYGVYNDGGTVTVENSTITDIGYTPFNGVQTGIGVYFVNPSIHNSGWPDDPADGTISNNVITQYQKGGITVNGAGSTASVTDNTVTGLGPVGFIAQNGIQFGYGAIAVKVSGNTVSGNIYTEEYTPPPYVSTGILFVDATMESLSTKGQIVGQLASENHVFDNQADITVVGP